MALTPDALEVTIGQDLEVVEGRDQPSLTYKVNWTAGKISGKTDGIDAIKQAIYKILQTERYAYLIYSWSYGVEMSNIIGQSSGVSDLELRRVIREALLQDERIKDVYDMQIARTTKRTVSVSFKAETVSGSTTIETEVISIV